MQDALDSNEPFSLPDATGGLLTAVRRVCGATA
jgi:hypothetical protein